MDDQPHHDLIEALLHGADPDTLLPDALAMASALGPTVPQAQHDHHAYGRTLLRADVRGEVLLMKWRAGMFCAPHDHAQAHGVVFLLDGVFIERGYTWRKGQLRQSSEHRATSPSWVRFERGRIHDMMSEASGLSLHVYWPCIEGMKVYDTAQSLTLEVDARCGAWVPHDASMILNTTPWSSR